MDKVLKLDQLTHFADLGTIKHLNVKPPATYTNFRSEPTGVITADFEYRDIQHSITFDVRNGEAEVHVQHVMGICKYLKFIKKWADEYQFTVCYTESSGRFVIYGNPKGRADAFWIKKRVHFDGGITGNVLFAWPCISKALRDEYITNIVQVLGHSDRLQIYHRGDNNRLTRIDPKDYLPFGQRVLLFIKKIFNME